jgi:hypothetical protein
MSQSDHIDRSRQASSEEIRKSANSTTSSIIERRLAQELIEIAYEFQFEKRDRREPRRKVQALVIDAIVRMEALDS